MSDNLDELRHIEGFPVGEDEDLLALSDPPHYTAYPNPHIAEFVGNWGTPFGEVTDDYHREPFVADVSEGKGGAIYSAHGYHTKVPYKAIVPFVEHYTEPGDIVFDGFCGTGMTGVAAQMVGRRAILWDLSPLATFVAYNYNSPPDSRIFEREAKRILKEVEAECGWMYETRHTDGRQGRINYTVWSDVFLCPYCRAEIVFSEAAVKQDTGRVRRRFSCPECNAEVTKQELDRSFEHVRDRVLGQDTQRARQEPVLINYSVGGRRYEKRLEPHDLALIRTIEEQEIPYWFPSDRMPEGDEARRNDAVGITHVHHFYTWRSLWTLSCVFHKLRALPDDLQRWMTFTFEQAVMGMSKWARYVPTHYSQVNQGLSGTLYIGSQVVETSVSYIISGKITRLVKAFGEMRGFSSDHVLVSTQSATASVAEASCSVDYIFTDPPFGANLMYAALNFLMEAWLRVVTNSGSEAVIDRIQEKDLSQYRELMTRSFAQMYAFLKPGRWITVVFHNSKASVWNAIQEALARAGFLVAQVTILDKKQGTFKQVTSAGAVKNDLVINAYKPRTGFTERFLSQTGQGLEAEFVRQHLAQLPVAANVERSKEMLYSKYLAYYVQHGYQVAYNAEQFYRALPQWGLVERDGYWFADEAQANEYETRKTKHAKRGTGQAVLFISDERSARQWLWDFLAAPKTYDEIYTAFVKALQTSEDELPEPMTMLEEGFIRTDGHWKRPDAVTQTELEAKRQARLLRQFEEYLETTRAGGRLKEVRKEALVAGFTEAYRTGRFQDILTVGRRLPKRLLESRADLFDFVDIAEAKVEG